MRSRAAQCTRRVACVVLLATAGIAAGCGTAEVSAPGPAPVTAGRAVPAGGVSLAQLGFRHGPAELITVPAGVRLNQRIDQPNVVTVSFIAQAGEDVGGWLYAHLPGAGFTITAHGPVTAEGQAALVFAGHGWSGAFTAGRGESALTLRRVV